MVRLNINRKRSGVPVLSRKQIDDIGERLVQDFCPDAMIHPQALDVDLFAQDYLGMEQDYQYLSHCGVYLGMTVFNDTNKVVVYNPEKQEAEYISARAKTIIIDNTLLEEKWLDEARALSEGLSRIYGDKSAAEYYNIIASGRRNGKKYVRLGYKIDHNTLLKIKQLPLFRDGANKGGIIVETEDSRMYPFGSLARRTIGYIQSNNLTNGAIGLEGKFNDVLHGEAGYEWTKITENHGRIHNYDSTSVEKRDGYDLRTTLDIDM